MDEGFKNSKRKNRYGGGGPQPGSGRPKGKKSPVTLEREEALRQFRERVAKNTHKIFEAQLDLAIGEKYLMVVHTIGKGARAKRETEIVTNPDVIKQYLDEELDNTDTEYYFMTTKPANNQALDSLLNRTFGRPKEDDETPTEVEVTFLNKVPSPKE
jgi:hypothetical protein